MMGYTAFCDKVCEKYNIRTGKRNIFIIGTPNHGNLGDHAIWYATQKIAEGFFPESNVSDVDMDDFWADIGAIVNLIQEQDIIVLQGGGNFGNYYMEDEMIRRCAAACFPDNKLIMFPQTVYFSDDGNGKKEMNKSIRIYGNNKNLTLIARDRHSYKILEENFVNDILFLPDAAFSLNFTDQARQRDGVLFCFRNDTEGIVSPGIIMELEAFLCQKGERLRYMDTQVENYARAERERLLSDKIGEFQTAKLVVTDRLHGMIFSAITGTPCIVFDNFNSKIRNTFLDLDGLDYIKMVSNGEEFAMSYELLMQMGAGFYDEKPVAGQFTRALGEIMRKPVVHEKGDICHRNLLEILGSWSLRVTALQEQVKERVDELAVYKEWTDSLQRQNEDLRNAMQDRERQWNIQQRELYRCIKFEREKNVKRKPGSRK